MWMNERAVIKENCINFGRISLVLCALLSDLFIFKVFEKFFQMDKLKKNISYKRGDSPMRCMFNKCHEF